MNPYVVFLLYLLTGAKQTFAIRGQLYFGNTSSSSDHRFLRSEPRCDLYSEFIDPHLECAAGQRAVH